MLGLIDVPGHEKFVHTMAAGACGLEFALLVVAADGIMPQTREHVEILHLLGVTRGAIALTKNDRADAARLAQVSDEIHAWLASTLFDTISGIELMHRIRKGQFNLATFGIKDTTAPAVWNAVLFDQ